MNKIDQVISEMQEDMLELPIDLLRIYGLCLVFFTTVLAITAGAAAACFALFLLRNGI